VDPSASERDIQRMLAGSLDILEPGLKLVEQELFLPTGHGLTRSFLDLCARDRLDRLVVIEVKKSKATSREAVHEILKYVAAIRALTGVANDRIRALVVSTDWDELARPFDDLRAMATFEVAGFALSVASGGTVLEAKRRAQLEGLDPVLLCSMGTLSMFSDAATRDGFTRSVHNALKETRFDDHALISLDYLGDDSRILHPFASGLITAALPLDEQVRIVADYEDGDVRLAEEILDESPHYGKELSLLRLMENWDLPTPREVNELRPSVLMTLITHGWSVARLEGSGRLSKRAQLYGDHDLLRGFLVESDEPDADLLVEFASLTHPAAMQALTHRTARWLERVSIWREGVLRALSDMDGLTGEVGVRAWFPDDMLALLLSIDKAEESMPPLLEVVFNLEKGPTYALGSVHFDPQIKLPPVKDVVLSDARFAFLEGVSGYGRSTGELMEDLGFRFDFVHDAGDLAVENPYQHFLEVHGSFVNAWKRELGKYVHL
jgi:hypothetical protein